MKKYFGGEYLKHKRKCKRILDTNKPIHLVLSLKRHLPCMFDPRDKVLKGGFYKTAEKYGIKIYQLVLNHSHVHLIIVIPDRKSYNALIRELTSKIVAYFCRVTKIKFKNIFENRPFTRVATWGRKSIEILNNYMKKNEKESGYRQLRQSLERLFEKSQSGQLELFLV